MQRLQLLLISLVFLCACTGGQQKTINLDERPDYLRRANEKLTQVIVHDIFSPPVASRIYAYTSIAAYEGIVLQHPGYRSLAGQLNGFTKGPKPEEGQEYSFPLVSLASFYKVAQALVFSEEDIALHRQEAFEELRKADISKEVFTRSIALGEQVGQHILDWAAKDNYHQSRSFEKYTIRDDVSSWQPTPPSYMEGIEPHWSRIRPFVLDSSSQFIPERPTPFGTDKESNFFKEAMEIVESSKMLTQEQKDIAAFWDCNPYVMNVRGHVMFATKKITPGGHWMGIACLASEKAGADWIQTTEALVKTAIALADGFISCWDEKYRSICIRPETYINQYIDEAWVPLLQTPPFPEYTSGHSVISNAAAKALTSVLGDNFHFVDSTEVAYGLPVREFTSFQHAADEAALSRFYGGIHYMPAIENGAVQGVKIGEWIVSELKLKNNAPQLLVKGEDF
jgi:hypothetical protein